jgi:hypothetical protein
MGGVGVGGASVGGTGVGGASVGGTGVGGFSGAPSSVTFIVIEDPAKPNSISIPVYFSFPLLA